MHLSQAGNPGLFFLVPWVVFFPAIGLLINIAFGHRMSEKAIGAVASAASGLTFVVSVLLAASLGVHPEAVRWTVGEWIHVGNLQLDWTFRADTLSVTMMLVVSLVGTLIHVYAIGYMHEDVRFKSDPKQFRRFFVFMNLFIAMMMILVSGDSYLMLFVGWEGVGLCSFLLIGFWYEMDTLGRPSWANSDAAKKAFIANRIGDFGFLIAAFLMFWGFGSLQFDTVFQGAGSIAGFNAPLIMLITLFMLLGVTGKSAQIPLVRLAAGRDGRPNTGLGADPCGDHGDRRRVPGGALGTAVRGRTGGTTGGRNGRRGDGTLRRDDCQSRNSTSRRCWRTPQSVSSATWWRAWVWARLAPVCSTW